MHERARLLRHRLPFRLPCRRRVRAGRGPPACDFGGRRGHGRWRIGASCDRVEAASRLPSQPWTGRAAASSSDRPRSAPRDRRSVIEMMTTPSACASSTPPSSKDSSVRLVGDDLDQVAEAAAIAPPEPTRPPRRRSPANPPVAGEAGEATARQATCSPRRRRRRCGSRRPARAPAAAFTRLAGNATEITVNGVDTTSILLLMTLGIGQGATVHIEVMGPMPQPRSSADGYA